MFDDAPWYWFGERLASVSPGSKIESCERDEVADHLRDRDRLAERAAEPEDDGGDDAAAHDGTTTVRTISQRVAPSPTAPSSSSPGRSTKSSRQIDDVIGMIMIVSTSIAANTVDSTLSAPFAKIGIQPRKLLRNGCTCCAHERREHVDPPEPDDDARHGGEHLDQRPDRAADRRRRELAQEEADRDRERARRAARRRTR